MINVAEYITQTAIKDPGRLFETPLDVTLDPRLSHNEKRTILQNWQLDQHALLRAEDENMSQLDGSSHPSRLLEKISRAMRQIDLH
jgi:hypothetical protein